MKLYLIRHGESEANVKYQYAGQTDVKLTELGRKQARAICPILASINFDRVYSSDLSRAIDTQRLALPGVEGIRTPLLREFDVGELAGHSYDQLESANISKVRARDYTVYGGEDSDMVCSRLHRFLSQLEENPCENVAAFVHNGIMISMLRLALGTAFDYTAARSGNCAVHVFEFSGGKWRLLAWNYMNTV